MEAGFYELTMDAAASRTMAETAYETAYASPLWLASINAQPIANALLSFAVNMGTFSAVETLQLLWRCCGRAHGTEHGCSSQRA